MKDIHGKVVFTLDTIRIVKPLFRMIPYDDTIIEIPAGTVGTFTYDWRGSGFFSSKNQSFIISPDEFELIKRYEVSSTGIDRCPVCRTKTVYFQMADYCPKCRSVVCALIQERRQRLLPI